MIIYFTSKHQNRIFVITGIKFITILFELSASSIFYNCKRMNKKYRTSDKISNI